MKISSLKKIPPKKLIVFDLDGTVAPTKAPMDHEMTVLLKELLVHKKVAIIGGGKYGIFKLQLHELLRAGGKLLQNLFLFPTSATSFYRYRSGWKNVYALELSRSERTQAKKAFRRVMKEMRDVLPQRVYGPTVEDRRTQVTYSTLGQDVVKILGAKKGVPRKIKWSKDNHAVKMEITRRMAKLIPKLEVRAAGYTSIDVTKKGIDKAYGLRQISKHLGVSIKDMIFMGDAIYPDGNDYAVVGTGVDYISVSGPEQVKKTIRQILK